MVGTTSTQTGWRTWHAVLSGEVEGSCDTGRRPGRRWDRTREGLSCNTREYKREEGKGGGGKLDDISHAKSRLWTKEKAPLTMVASGGGCVGQGPRHKYTHTYAHARVRCRSTCEGGTTGGVTVQGTKRTEAIRAMGTHKQGPSRCRAGERAGPTRSAQPGRTCGRVGETCASPGKETGSEWGRGRSALASHGGNAPKRTREVDVYARKGAGAARGDGEGAQGQMPER